MTTTSPASPANFTRTSQSFVRRFAREGRFHLIPIYWLLRLSDFAREGMENSGSYRFADHMYRGIPSGRGLVGKWIDRLLLNLPAARSMRRRCFAATGSMHAAFARHLLEHPSTPFRILTVPCGLPRDVRDFAASVARRNPALFRQIEYTGMDLDPAVIAAARDYLAGSPLEHSRLLCGNALQRSDYPEAPHFISSTGLGEFLDDTALERFYANVFAALAPGGTFFTSAAARGTGSASLLKTFEFEVHYRTRTEVSRILARQAWDEVDLSHDRIGLQTFVHARKPLSA